MIRIDDLIYAGWMRADATGLGKAKHIVVGDQDGFPELARGRGSASTTPRVNCQVPDSSS